MEGIIIRLRTVLCHVSNVLRRLNTEEECAFIWRECIFHSILRAFSTADYNTVLINMDPSHYCILILLSPRFLQSSKPSSFNQRASQPTHPFPKQEALEKNQSHPQSTVYKLDPNEAHNQTQLCSSIQI